MLTPPLTHAGLSPFTLMGELVRVRPWYHVPSGSLVLSPARSPWAFEGRVVNAFTTTVMVRFTWDTTAAPWGAVGAYEPDELHHLSCECPACLASGEGIHSLHGA